MSRTIYLPRRRWTARGRRPGGARLPRECRLDAGRFRGRRHLLRDLGIHRQRVGRRPRSHQLVEVHSVLLRASSAAYRARIGSLSSCDNPRLDGIDPACLVERRASEDRPLCLLRPQQLHPGKNEQRLLLADRRVQSVHAHLVPRRRRAVLFHLPISVLCVDIPRIAARVAGPVRGRVAGFIRLFDVDCQVRRDDGVLHDHQPLLAAGRGRIALSAHDVMGRRFDQSARPPPRWAGAAAFVSLALVVYGLVFARPEPPLSRFDPCRARIVRLVRFPARRRPRESTGPRSNQPADPVHRPHFILAVPLALARHRPVPLDGRRHRRIASGGDLRAVVRAGHRVLLPCRAAGPRGEIPEVNAALGGRRDRKLVAVFLSARLAMRLPGGTKPCR